jgi:hypothetical protein
MICELLQRSEAPSGIESFRHALSLCFYENGSIQGILYHASINVLADLLAHVLAHVLVTCS